MGIVRRKLLLVSIGMPIRDIQYFNVEGNCLLSCHPIQWGVLYDTETRIIYSHMLLQCVGPENDFIHSFPWRVYCFMDPYTFLLTLDPLITSLEFLIIFLGVGMDTFWNQALAQSAPLPLTRQF